jgi:hypothetical protein
MGRVEVMITRRLLILWLVGILVIPSFFISFSVVAIQAAGISSGSLNFAGEAVPLSQKDIYENLDQELLLLSEARSRVYLSLRRQSRTLPIVEKALKAQGVPDDFKYYPLTLTGLDPRYRSGALRGIWRLSERFAQAIGLKVNKEVDERLDPTLSSEAVAKHLKDIYSRYGSWTLAMAALVDESAVAGAIQESGGIKNFYQLYLPETLEKTVYQVLAGKLVFSDPKSYGYSPSKSWPVIAKSREISQGGSLRELAQKYKLDYKSFRDLNPHVLTDKVPNGTYLNLP